MRHQKERKLANVSERQERGGLAHLARARHWQCRGDRFESDTLHKKQKLHSVLNAAFIFISLFHCSLNVTGTVNLQRTGTPRCLPGIHFGIVEITRTASLSK